MKQFSTLRNLALAVGVLLTTSALAQIQGVTTTIKPERTETVASIMKRAAITPIKPKRYKDIEVEGHRRDSLPSNPLSPSNPGVLNVQEGAINLASRGAVTPFFSQQLNFDGPDLPSSGGFYPPDTVGDVSLTQVLMPVNGRIRAYDRNGNLGTLNADLDVFFGASVADPRCRYDRLTNRWFIVVMDLASGVNSIRVGVSSPGTITGSTSFTFFTIPSNAGNPAVTDQFWDYPTLAVDANGVYIGGNCFNSAGTSFLGTRLFAINKANLLATTPSATVTTFNLAVGSGAGIYTPQGADNDDPSPTAAYIVGVDNAVFSQLTMRRITPSGTSFTSSANLNVTVPSTTSPIQVPVPGGSIDVVDDRLFAAKIFLNRDTGLRTLWTSHNIGLNASGTTSSPNRTGVRWYQVTNLGTTPISAQTGTIFDSSATPLFYNIPSLATNLQGHTLFGFTRANGATSPGIATSFLLSGSSVTSAPAVQVAGTGTYNPGNTRWGDYSNTVVDPRDGMSIWTFQEYVKTTNTWGTRAVKMRAPAPTVSGVSPSSITQGQTVTVNVTGTGLFDPGTGYPDRLAASVSGTGVTVNSVTYNTATSISISLTATPAAATGSRVITVTNPDGQTATTSINVATAAVVSGTATLNSWSGPIGDPVLVLEVLDNTTNAVLQTNNINLGSGGTFSVPTSLAPGTYKLRLKGQTRFLRQAISNVTFGAGGATGVSFTLRNGDVSGDNVVGPSDLLAVRAAFGSTSSSSNWNANADLNGDGVVGPGDLLIVRGNFGQSGDN